MNINDYLQKQNMPSAAAMPVYNAAQSILSGDFSQSPLQQNAQEQINLSREAAMCSPGSIESLGLLLALFDAAQTEAIQRYLQTQGAGGQDGQKADDNVAPVTDNQAVNGGKANESDGRNESGGKVTEDVIEGDFKPSGVKAKGLEYKTYHTAWENYCPGCRQKGTLKNNPKGVAEGEITCGKCDADFDGVTGWDKTGSPRWQLKSAQK